VARGAGRQLPKFLEPSELVALLAAAHDSHPRDYALVVIMAYAGLRVAEVCALTCGDVTERTVFVRHGKGDKQRYVPTHPKILQSLEAVREPVEVRTDYIFTSVRRPGRPMTTRWAQRTVERLCAAAGIPREKAHPHSLRHTAATNLLRKTGNLLFVQRFLGHASVATTQIYAHVVLDDLAEAVNRLE